MSQLVTVKELAELLQFLPSWIYERTRQGPRAIPFIRVGKYIRFDAHEVIEFFKAKGQSRALSALLVCTFFLFFLAGVCFTGQASVASLASVASHSVVDGDNSQFQPGLFAIRAYQRFISPLLGPRCNFRPSCSRYAAEAIQKYGIVKGSIMAADRLTRCHYCAGLYYRRSKGLLEDPVADNVLSGNSDHRK